MISPWLFEDIVFHLLQLGLGCNHDFLSLKLENISSEKWQKLLQISIEQGVAGLLFSAIEHLSNEKRPNRSIMMQWFGHVITIERYNNRYRNYTSELVPILKSKKLTPIILKGLVCAKYYPIPNRRPLGDLDLFLFDDEQECAYNKGNDIARNLALKVEIHDYKHSHITFKSLAIENHQYCTEIRGPHVRKEFERELRRLLIADIYNKVEENLTPDSCLYPCPQFNALFLMAHSYNHFIDEGLSLRQICDWAMFVKVEQEQVDWKHFILWMERIGIKRFANCINTIVSNNLGIALNFEYTEEPELADKIIRDALYERERIHNSGLSGWRYRWKQLCIMYHSRWKYSEVCGQNFLIEYLRNVWYYLTERHPKIHTPKTI